ncbi:DUF2742 domain-containing protein [Streptomyces sp. S07_1.15]|uniref:DUF2742 domain-containing protein n=1 Tax=Streptomyces sp. S07_1.15 TaxID=2873925 RepID=UPI001D14789D|nr:DUF2742 domain-containing protein [Streptomyces sp. S07_1.15]MCC3652728.1 DUF2742 domain-containing protein [Streptomyces sp. S07_1.15]
MTTPDQLHDQTAQWAATEIGHLTTAPTYGTPAWLALDPADPRRQAALIQAAEAWRTTQHTPAGAR